MPPAVVRAVVLQNWIPILENVNELINHDRNCMNLIIICTASQ